MKNKLTCILLLFSSVAFAQKVAVTTNAAYWATATLNLGAEVAIAPRMTIDLIGTYNPFTFSDNKKIMHWGIQPEWRYWTCQKFYGHFVGVHAHYARYNSGLETYRYDGWLVGGGVSYGYQWVLGRRWNLEVELGVGYAYMNYDKYYRTACGKFVGSDQRNYFGPTKVSISFLYFLW